jgi:hypothetical protein
MLRLARLIFHDLHKTVDRPKTHVLFDYSLRSLSLSPPTLFRSLSSKATSHGKPSQCTHDHYQVLEPSSYSFPHVLYRMPKIIGATLVSSGHEISGSFLQRHFAKTLTPSPYTHHLHRSITPIDGHERITTILSRHTLPGSLTPPGLLTPQRTLSPLVPSPHPEKCPNTLLPLPQYNINNPNPAHPSS